MISKKNFILILPLLLILYRDVASGEDLQFNSKLQRSSLHRKHRSLESMAHEEFEGSNILDSSLHHWNPNTNHHSIAEFEAFNGGNLRVKRSNNRQMCSPSSSNNKDQSTPKTRTPPTPLPTLSNVICEEGRWACADGNCIDKVLVCNNQINCNDSSDEAVKTCGCYDDEFRCEDDKCIKKLQKCDIIKDCPGGEDEENCKNHQCDATQFKCKDGFCIHCSKMCDHSQDCPDNSDEEGCHYPECYKSQFRCSNQECIWAPHVCDGINDCKDGGDEKECQDEHFRECRSGKRVHKTFWCDGYIDCEDDHADEINCTKCDETTMFLCPNGRCISISDKCDGQCDCHDENGCHDEIGCTPKYYTKVGGVLVCNEDLTLTYVVNLYDRTKDRCLTYDDLCLNSSRAYKEYRCGLSEEVCKNGSWNPNNNAGTICRNGVCIWAMYIMNSKADCIGGEDENFERKPCKDDEWRCDSGQCIKKELQCNNEFNCSDKSDEIHCENHTCKEGLFRCEGGQCIAKELECNHYENCLDGTDEHEHCDPPPTDCREDEFKCKSDDGKCISNATRCVSVDITLGNGCKDKSHIYGCEMEECPQGKNFFKCHRGPCYTIDQVCDRKKDCDSWEDEKPCEDECSNSHPPCHCSNRVANCTRRRLSIIPKTYYGLHTIDFSDNFLNNTLSKEKFPVRKYLMSIDLSRNHLQHLHDGIFSKLPLLTKLILKDNRLTNITKGAFKNLKDLSQLYLEGNQINYLGPSAFLGLSSLNSLDLSGQGLNDISNEAFLGLTNLLTLDLSNNNLTTLDRDTFKGLGNLTTLDLTKNPLNVDDPEIFSHLKKLEKLSSDKWHICCLVTKANLHVAECKPVPEDFSSCEDLMSKFVLRVFIWVLGAIALLGNIFVIIWRSLNNSRIRDKMHAFLIVNLAVGDLMMGVYMLIIAIADTYYRDVYAKNEAYWKNSPYCKLAGFLSTFSSELSVFSLTAITVQRLLIAISPTSIFHSKGRILKLVMVGVYVLVTLMAALPLSDIDYFKDFYGRSGVCLALPLTKEKPNGWEYSVFIFLVVNLLNFIVIAVSYILMYTVVRKGKNELRRDGEISQQTDRSMAFKMTLIVATDAACWLPIICIAIASLCEADIPPQVFSWIAVFVLPLNSALNPILYTMATPGVRKSLTASQKGRSRRSRSNSGTSVSRWSTFRTRLSTDSSEIQPTTRTEVRMIKNKPTVGVLNNLATGLNVSRKNGRTSSQNNGRQKNFQGGQRAIMLQRLPEHQEKVEEDQPFQEELVRLSEESGESIPNSAVTDQSH